MSCFWLPVSALGKPRAQIGKSGIGFLQLKDLRVSVSENGLVGILNSDEELCGPLAYQLLGDRYKQILNSAKNSVENKALRLDNSTLFSEQVLRGQDCEIRCRQRASLDEHGVLTLVYTVTPVTLNPSLRLKQQRLVLELKDKNLGKSLRVVDSAGQTQALERFAGNQHNPQAYLFSDPHQRDWRFSVTPLKGTSKVTVQLYSSYSKFINMSVFSRKSYSLKLQFDLSRLLGLAAQAPVATRAASAELTGDALEQVPSGGANLLPNGSFEFGMNGWKPEWASVGKNRVWTLVPRDDTSWCARYTGQNLRGVKLISFPHTRNRGDIFTVAADLKGSLNGQTVMLGISGAPVHAQKRSSYFLWKTFTLSEDWQEYAATFKLPSHWKMGEVCFMVGPEKAGTPFWVDHAQMYPGKAPGQSSPQEQLGLRLETGRVGNMFLKDETGVIQAELVNRHSQPQTIRLTVDSLNLLGGKRQLLDKTVTVPGRGAIAMELPIDTDKRGYFNLGYRLRSDSGATKTGSLPYCVITDNRPLDRHRFGINFHMERPLKDQTDTALGVLAKMGFGSIRAWWDWDVVEKRRGQFNWAKTDEQVDLCQKHDLEIVPTLVRMYGPKWTVPDRFQTPPDDLSLWDTYVRNTLTRYKGRINYWEVWNEPDVSPVLKHKPELYLDILKRTSATIKELDPQAKVIGICGSHPWFFDAMLRAGAIEHLDVISYHSYYYKYNPEVALVQWNEAFQKLLSKHKGKREVPVWNTEVGVINERGGHIESEENSLRSCGILLRNYAAAFACGTERVYWFTSSLISLYAHSLFDYQYIPTPAMVAFNAMSEQLAGAEYTGPAERPGDEGFFGYTFQTRDHRSLAIVWFNGFPAERSLRFQNPDKLSVLDIMGAPVALKDGAYTMTSSFPLYVSADSLTILKDEIRLAGIGAEASRADLSGLKAGAASPAKPSVGPFQPTAGGMIVDWTLFGPFANPGGRGYDQGLDIDYLKPVGGEKDANLNLDAAFDYTWPDGMKHFLENAPDKTRIRSLEYHGASVADYYGSKDYIDFLMVLEPEKYVVGYAFCYLYVPQETKIKLKTGSDDGCLVFLNHQKLWRNKIYRKAKPDDDTILATLHKGLNPLLVKISQDGGGWGFYLRVTDMDDQPIKALKVWL
jgi:hypothetical protein